MWCTLKKFNRSRSCAEPSFSETEEIGVVGINKITLNSGMKRVKYRTNVETANCKTRINRVRLNVTREKEKSKNKKNAKAETAWMIEKYKERRWNVSKGQMLQASSDVTYGLGEKKILRKVSRGERHEGMMQKNGQSKENERIVYEMHGGWEVKR